MSGCYECAWGKVAGCWRCGSARGMDARQGRDAQRLDGEATTARSATPTRPETTAPQPVAPEGEALTSTDIAAVVACVRQCAVDTRWEAKHKDAASRAQLTSEAARLDRIANILAATPPSPQAAVATEGRLKRRLIEWMEDAVCYVNAPSMSPSLEEQGNELLAALRGEAGRS